MTPKTTMTTKTTKTVQAGGTRDRILEEALFLFSVSGFSAVSMSDIASRLSISKAALYKHFDSKEAILEAVAAMMADADGETAAACAVPAEPPTADEAAYRRASMASLRQFSKAIFRHWTTEEAGCRFRRMLTLEQYRSPAMGELFRRHISTGPLDYVTALFRAGAEETQAAAAADRARRFYGPLFLLYSEYDAAGTPAAAAAVVVAADRHIDGFPDPFGEENRESAPIIR